VDHHTCLILGQGLTNFCPGWPWIVVLLFSPSE
jgi:hypothetical protein